VQKIEVHNGNLAGARGLGDFGLVRVVRDQQVGERLERARRRAGAAVRGDQCLDLFVREREAARDAKDEAWRRGRGRITRLVVTDPNFETDTESMPIDVPSNRDDDIGRAQAGGLAEEICGARIAKWRELAGRPVSADMISGCRLEFSGRLGAP
jgi:hypothetical protein